MTPLTSQLYSFGLTLLIGLGIGLFYDLYCQIHKFWKTSKPLSHIGDYLFWLIATVFTFMLLLLGNFGEIRFYVIMGLIAGALLYIKLVGKFLTPLIVSICRGICRIVQFIVKVILFPFRLLKKVVLIPLGFISLVLAKIGSIIQKVLWKLFGRPASMVNSRVKRKYYRTKERLILRLLRALKRK